MQVAFYVRMAAPLEPAVAAQSSLEEELLDVLESWVAALSPSHCRRAKPSLRGRSPTRSLFGASSSSSSRLVLGVAHALAEPLWTVENLARAAALAALPVPRVLKAWRQASAAASAAVARRAQGSAALDSALATAAVPTVASTAVSAAASVAASAALSAAASAAAGAATLTTPHLGGFRRLRAPHLGAFNDSDVANAAWWLQRLELAFPLRGAQRAQAPLFFTDGRSFAPMAHSTVDTYLDHLLCATAPAIATFPNTRGHFRDAAAGHGAGPEDMGE